MNIFLSRRFTLWGGFLLSLLCAIFVWAFMNSYMDHDRYPIGAVLTPILFGHGAYLLAIQPVVKRVEWLTYRNMMAYLKQAKRDPADLEKQEKNISIVADYLQKAGFATTHSMYGGYSVILPSNRDQDRYVYGVWESLIGVLNLLAQARRVFGEYIAAQIALTAAQRDLAKARNKQPVDSNELREAEKEEKRAQEELNFARDEMRENNISDPTPEVTLANQRRVIGTEIADIVDGAEKLNLTNQLYWIQNWWFIGLFVEAPKWLLTGYLLWIIA